MGRETVLSNFYLNYLAHVRVLNGTCLLAFHTGAQSFMSRKEDWLLLIKYSELSILEILSEPEAVSCSDNGRCMMLHTHSSFPNCGIQILNIFHGGGVSALRLGHEFDPTFSISFPVLRRYKIAVFQLRKLVEDSRD